MSELLQREYRRLFEIQLLHHYWLDEGASIFDHLADQAVKARRLLAYDVRRFLALKPTNTTRQTLKASQCLLEETALGAVVLCDSRSEFSGDTVFEFMLTVKDSRLFEYTALTLRPQRICEAYDELHELIYRYKENVPLLSNLTGATRGVGSEELLFLSREYSPLAEDDQVEALGAVGNALAQLTSDGPNATRQELAADGNNFPVYLHQGDVPAITPPAAVTGVPSHGVRLSNDISDDVFVLLRLTAVRPDKEAFSFVDATGKAKTMHPVYQLHFRNRSTFWQYRDKATGADISIELNALPLTYFGNAGQKQKPSENLMKAEKTGTIINRLISEVYV